MNSTTDRIEKQVVLRAPRERVWRAISDAKRFGSWFGMRFDGPLGAGARVTGHIVPTTVDAEIAGQQAKYEGAPAELTIDRVEPKRLFSFRWHPYAVDSKIDYSHEPTTLVEFVLKEVPEGTLLTITESGFDEIPADRRAKAFESNEQGWVMQLKLIDKYIAAHPEE